MGFVCGPRRSNRVLLEELMTPMGVVFGKSTDPFNFTDKIQSNHGTA